MVGHQRQPGIPARGCHRLGGLFVLASPLRRPISRFEVTLVIETQGLSKNFDDFAAVCGVTLKVDAAQVLALLGPNGAGKTTTVRMLTSVLKPSAGWARVAGSRRPADNPFSLQKIGRRWGRSFGSGLRSDWA